MIACPHLNPLFRVLGVEISGLFCVDLFQQLQDLIPVVPGLVEDDDEAVKAVFGGEVSGVGKDAAQSAGFDAGTVFFGEKIYMGLEQFQGTQH